MKKTRNPIGIVLILLGLVILGLSGRQTNTGKLEESSYYAGTETSEEDSESVSKPSSEESEASTAEDEGETQPDKAETVYATADPEGNIKEITVTEILKTQGGGTLKDRSVLDDIKNVNGDEEYTETEEGVLQWEDVGQNIQYEGTTGKELPVSVSVTYYLNGKKISPSRLAGQSGTVKIRYEYENKETKKVKLNGKTSEVKVPFAVMTMAFLDPEHFFDIRVTNGKVMDMSGETVVVGYALPGLADSLKLADYESTEEITLPESVEFTAEVQDFEMEFSATVVTPGLFSELKDEDLEEGDDLVDAADDLNDASKALVKGSGELLSGTEQFGTYLSEYINGISQITTGVKSLGTAMKQLNDNKDQLSEGAQALEDGLKDLQDGLDQIEIPDTDEDSQGEESEETTKEIQTALTQFNEDAKDLKTGLSSLKKEIEALETFTAEAAAYKEDVEEAAKNVQTKAKEVWSSIDTDTLEETAQSQVEESLNASLADTGLSEEEKEAIIAQARGSIDLSSPLQSIRDDIDSALEEELEQLEALSMPEAPDSDYDVSGITALLKDMSTQLTTLLKAEESLSADTLTQLAAMEQALKTLKTSTTALYEGSQSLTDGIEDYNDGISQIYEAVTGFNENTGTLASAGVSLKSGFNSLTSGAETLSSGLETFDEEAIQKIKEAAGEDLDGLLEQVRLLKKADQSYTNFGGIYKGQKGSVQFIIETEEIKKD